MDKSNVASQSREESFALGGARQPVDADIALARGEAHQAGVPLPAALVLVVITSEAHDAAAPHLWRVLRGLRVSLRLAWR